ncbi:MAG TPA: GGDEF domain-containing protein [Gemmatimonadaceae bacterium]|jgi:diguanylate cyclase (GGDEF)-like protein
MQPFIEGLAGASAFISVGLAAIAVAQHREVRSLARLASVEPLSGLLNRREFMRALDAEVARASRGSGGFAVVLADVDGLKLINDSCGHRGGDRAILRVANALRVSVRASDTAGRIGGDEFAVVLPGAGDAAARRFLARVHSVLARHRRAGSVTVSGGIAVYPGHGVTGDALLETADASLYADKVRRSRRTPASIPRLVPGSLREAVQ